MTSSALGLRLSALGARRSARAFNAEDAEDMPRGAATGHYRAPRTQRSAFNGGVLPQNAEKIAKTMVIVVLCVLGAREQP
jgi:hypothetical protein